jgi:hypothetical protein
MTNQQWLDDAQRNFTHIEKTLGVVPDWAVLASWDRVPGHAITDEYGLGEDHLVKQCLAMRGTSAP